VKPELDGILFTKKKESANLNIFLISGIAFCYWIGQYIFVPILPLYVKSMTEDLKLIGLALSIYGLGHIFIRIPAGFFVSKLGKNKTLIQIGLVLLALGSIIMALSKDVNQLILGRGITGIAAGTWVPLVLLFNKSYSIEEQVKATALVAFVSAAARLTGASLSTLSFQAGGFLLPFLISATVSAIAVFIILPVREETLPPNNISIKQFVELITKKEVLSPSILSMLAQHVNWGVTFGFLPILAKFAGASDKTVALLVTLFFVFFLIGSYLVTALTKIIRQKTLVTIGFIALACGLIFAAIAHNMMAIYFSQACVGLGIGICEPLLMAMSIQTLSISDRPNAMGFHQTVYAVGMFTGPFLCGILSDLFGIQNMFLITLFILISTFLCFFRTLKK